METTELSIKEKNLIGQSRRNDELAKRRMAGHVLEVAAHLIAWLDSNGAGATYSTFCDDFGYQAIDGEDRSYLFRQVMEVIKFTTNMQHLD